MGNILIVDDERSIRITLKAFLEDEGHSVETAEEAESAMAILQNRPIDVILTDIILPRVSGVELLRRIRETSPHVQVIMMTGEPTLETVTESLRQGAIDYLQKPAGKNEILKAVRNACRVKHLIDEKLRLEAENRNYMNNLEQLVEERTKALAQSESAFRLQAQELSILNRLARKVNESITTESVVQHGLSEIVSAAEPDLAALFLREGENLLLRGAFPEQAKSQWQPDDAHKVGVCLCGLAVSENQAIYAVDIQSDPRCALKECRKAGFCSFAALPLKSGTEIIGVVGIATGQKRDFQQHAEFLEALSNEMAIGLKKSLLYEQGKQYALELKASLSRIEEAEAQRRMLEHHLQRSQKLEAIGTLASGIAHDFNNILGAVIGYAELALVDAPKGSKIRERLDMVLTAGERAKDLVKQILSFSRQSDDECKPIQIDHVVKEVLKFMRASLPATIKIDQYIDNDIGSVLADPAQVHQVLMNLCTNAHHAMAENGGVLGVEVTSVDLGSKYASPHADLKPGTYVKVSVKDSGHGIDEITLTRIFDPYFTTKEKGVGTGLGLAMVHGIMLKHGGAITVKSELGKGSVFDLYFPTIQKEAVLETRVREQMPTGNEHILLVDDEQLLVDMGKAMLEHLGYSVETRTSSVEALALFRAQPNQYAAVVTDMTMPNMTGDKLAEELMRIRPDIPVILCTGYGESGLIEKSKAMGIRAVVMKPILMAKIAQAIREALGDGRNAALGEAPKN